jgi:hypothetical protein
VLPTFFRGEFGTAGFFQYRQIDLHQLPHDGRSNIFVVVSRHVADSRNFLPGDIRVTRLQIVRQMAAGLGNNLDTALDEPLSLPIILERSSDITPNTLRMRSIASMMSIRRGMRERAITKTRGRLLLLSPVAGLCAGYHAS